MSKQMKLSAVVLVVLVSLLMGPAMSLASDFNWRQYEGATIRFLGNVHPWTDSIAPLISDFEELTGIKVIFVTFAYQQFRQNLAFDLAARTGTVDVFMLQPHQDARRFIISGWVESLDEYVTNDKITNPGFEFSDFTESGINAETIDGKLIGLPIQQSVHLLTYRRDLFEEYGVKVPETMEELEAAAAALTLDLDNDGTIDIYGIVNRGRVGAADHSVSSFLHSMGGRWLDENNKPAFNSPEGVDAFTLYGDLIRKYGPPGSTNFSWQEEVTMISQGQAAMCTDSNTFVSQYEDPEQSLVAGKLGYTVFPAGSAGSIPTTFLWGLSMASDSKHKEASWLFMQYVMSKEAMIKAAKDGIPAARQSAWQDESVLERFGSMYGLLETLEKSLAVATSEPQPLVVAVPEVRDAIGRAITTAIEGGDVAQALNRAAQEVQDIMDRTEN